MRSLIRLVAAGLLLFLISCEALPLHPSHDIGLRKDSQPGHSLVGDEAALAWKKVLCQLMHPGDSKLQIEATVREENTAETNQNDDQMVCYILPTPVALSSPPAVSEDSFGGSGGMLTGRRLDLENRIRGAGGRWQTCRLEHKTEPYSVGISLSDIWVLSRCIWGHRKLPRLRRPPR